MATHDISTAATGPASQRVMRLQRSARFIASLAAIVGAAHLVAWTSGYMTELGLSAITMKTNAAAGLLATGVGVLLLTRTSAGRATRLAAYSLALIVAVTGLLTLLENITGVEFGIDQLLAHEPPGALGTTAPNRMGVPASTSFLLLGVALLSLGGRQRRDAVIAQSLALVVLLIASLSSIGHLYGAEPLHAVTRLTAVAWPTAVALLMLAASVLCARPAEGFMAQVTAEDPGGAALRRWPPILLLPVILGWVRINGERNGFFDPATGTALVMIIVMVALSIVAYRSSIAVSRSSAKLSASIRELERSNKDLEQFAYICAHDLQEPLRQVQLYVQLLQSQSADKLDGKAAEYFQFVRSGAQRMEDLVTAVLHYSLAGAQQDPGEVTSCQEVVREVLTDLGSSIVKSGASVTTDHLPLVTGSRTQLKQLFQNLISNALKFSREGVAPQVHIGCRRDAARWVFSVTDNGIGIPAEFHPKVFRMFQRLHPRDKFGGTGIGLAVCKKIVESHGGEIWIQPQQESGVTFCFTLPAARPDMAQDGEPRVTAAG